MSHTEQETLIDLKSKIRRFIVDNFLFGSEEEPFSDDDSFLEKGIFDSTGVLELIQHIEENFSIKIEDDELVPENLDSLTNVTAFIMRKRG
jgi:acyl carrier protein